MNAFYSLIDRLIDSPPAERTVVEGVIWATFGVEQAVLTLDMSHFSLTVRRSGVLYYLAMIRRMHRITEPIVLEQGGHVVKFEADNLMAIFPTADAAVDAAILMNQAFASESVSQPDSQRIGVSIGIDFGRFLHIRATDCYGDAVNRAFKLGEDLAAESEILITREVHRRLSPRPGIGFEERHYTVSGLEMDAMSVVYPR